MQGPWSDGVPNGWQIRPLWSEFRRGKTLGDGSEELLSVYRDYGVIPKSSRDDNFNRPSEDLSKYQRVSVGDLVVNKMKAWQGSLGISNHDGIVSPAYFVYKATGSLERRFAHYLLRSKEYADHMAAISSGIRPNQWDLDPAQFAITPLLVPPPPKQRAIADYLDRETAQIDAFIAKNEELITLLAERRASVLSAAMGEGSPRMRLRQVLTLAQTGPFGTQLSASEYIDDGVPIINPSHIVEGVILHDPGVSVSIERAGELSRFRLSPDDIVLGRKGEVDKAALVDEESDGYLCGSDSMMLRPSMMIVYPKYLWWFLQSPPAHEQLERFAVGSTVVGLNQRTLRVVQLPVPSLEKQKAITADLNRATAAIGRAMSVAKRGVELARERRAALISAAVTGKIDVGVSV